MGHSVVTSSCAGASTVTCTSSTPQAGASAPDESADEDEHDGVGGEQQEAREAHAHSTELHVVHAWESDFRTAYPTDAVEQLRAAGAREAKDLIDEMLAEAGGGRRWANARVHPRPVEGSPAEALRT